MSAQSTHSVPQLLAVESHEQRRRRMNSTMGEVQYSRSSRAEQDLMLAETYQNTSVFSVFSVFTAKYTVK